MNYAENALLFEEIRNFRDFGGSRTGRDSVVRGCLFRSAALDRATPADGLRMEALGIQVVIDLRRWSERRVAPSRRPANFVGSVVETIEQDVLEAPHQRYLAGNNLSRETLRDRVLDFYREAPFDPRHMEIFRRAIEALAIADGPIHIHCAAGKDRTGILVSLVQHILGVSEDDQMAEYLLTAQDHRLVDELSNRSIEIARAQGKHLTRDAAEALTSVDSDYLEMAWTSMREHHGSIDDYVAALGITAEMINMIKRRYII